MWQYLRDLRDENMVNIWLFYWDNKELRKIKFRLWTLIIDFNGLESLIEALICFAIDNRSDTLWMIIISNLWFLQKVDLLDNIMLWYNFTDRNLAKEITKELININSFRNACIHWRREEPTENWFIKHKVKAKKWWIEFRYSKIESGDIDKCINSIYHIYNVLYENLES